MNKQLISFQNQRQPVSKTSSATVDLGEMVLISREKKMHTSCETCEFHLFGHLLRHLFGHLLRPVALRQTLKKL